MKPVRSLAVRLAEFTVRRAAPAYKDWAEGVAREVEFIPNDWRALGWALGSTRVLLEPRQEPLRSLDDVPRATQKLVELVRGGYNTLVMLWQGFLFALLPSHHSSAGRHFGDVLMLSGCTIAGINLLLERRRLRPPWKDDVYDDLGACVLFYRRELVVQQSRMWISAVGGLSFSIGFPLHLDWLDWPGRILTLVLITLCCLVLALKFSRYYRANQQRLDELDRFLAPHCTGAI